MIVCDAASPLLEGTGHIMHMALLADKTNDSLTFEAHTGPREGLLPSQLQPKTGAKQEL